MVLYRIEAPMEQALAMADVLVKACEQLAVALENLRGFKDLDQYWIEIHRLENDGDRLYQDAVASLFANGIDPMFVIRWRDIFLRLERAVDATETAAHTLEGIVIKTHEACGDLRISVLGWSSRSRTSDVRSLRRPACVLELLGLRAPQGGVTSA